MQAARLATRSPRGAAPRPARPSRRSRRMQRTIRRRPPHAVLGEVLLHRLASARAFRADQHPAIERFERSLECGERIVGAAVHLHGWQPANGSVDVDSGLRSGHRDVDARKRLQRSAQFVVRQEELRRRQQRTCLVAAHQSIARLGVLPEAIDGRVDVAVQRDDRVARKIVDECRGRVEEERQVVLDAARRDACRDVLVQRRLRRIAFEHFAEPAAKARTARIVQRELARGQQPHVTHRIQRALRVGVERLDALDLVPEEIETVRERSTHRIKVDQAAANAELARRHHLRHVRVAGERQLRAKRVDVELLALRQEERVRREKRLRCKSIERRLCGDQCNVALAARDSIQRRESLGHEVLMRGEVVVRQRLPVREDADGKLGREPGDLSGESRRCERVGADDRKRPPLRVRGKCQLRERERVARLGKRREPDALSRCRNRRSERRQRGKRSCARDQCDGGFAAVGLLRGGGRRGIGRGRRHAKYAGMESRRRLYA